jgi:hypothetical protein
MANLSGNAGEVRARNSVYVNSTEIDEQYDHDYSYGGLSRDAIVAKFEETPIEYDEMSYDSFARTQLTDRRPDTNLFADEGGRGRTNASSGYLQLRYYGHRGDADEVYRPEIFQGFAGEEDRDPRGINVEPDHKQLVRQHEARNRFIRFTSDAQETVTGGGRSESEVRQDNLKLRGVLKDRLSVFSQQIDGRNNPKAAVFGHVSSAQYSTLSPAYGEENEGMGGKQRKSSLLRKRIFGSAAYRDETDDQTRYSGKYTQVRRRKSKGAHNPRLAVHQNKFGKCDYTQTRRQMARLASTAAACRKNTQAITGDEVEFGSSVTTVVAKSAKLTDIIKALAHSKQESDFKQSDLTQVGKTARRGEARNTKLLTIDNTDRGVYDKLDVRMIYKSLKQGEVSRIKYKLERDSAAAVDYVEPLAGKSAGKDKLLRGGAANNSKSTMQDEFGSAKITTAYKSKRREKHQSGVNSSLTVLDADSDKTIGGKTAKYTKDGIDRVDRHRWEGRASTADNLHQERRTAPLGRKYTLRAVDRDSVESPADGFGDRVRYA